MGTFDHFDRGIAADEQQSPEREIIKARNGRAPRERHAIIEDGLLETRGRNRSAEKQESIRDTAFSRRIAHDHQDRQCRIDHEENDQEGFDDGEIFRTIGTGAPCKTDQECKDEGGEIEITPTLEPIHRDDERVEQQVVTEQHDVVAASGRSEDRCEESARDAQSRERLGILAGSHEHAYGADGCKGQEGRRRPDHLVAREHEVDDQIQDGEAAALQRMAEHFVHAFGHAVAAEPDHRHGCDSTQPQSHGNRHESITHGQSQTGRHAEEQQHDADLGEDVATDQPAPEARKIVGPGGWFSRFGPGWSGGFGRHCARIRRCGRRRQRQRRRHWNICGRYRKDNRSVRPGGYPCGRG